MTKALICDKWEMNLPEPTPGDEWFLDWVLRAPVQAGKHLKCSYLAMQSLKEYYLSSEIDSAREYFGGLGSHAMMVQDLFNPDEHEVLEYSQQAINHLVTELPLGAVLPIHGDSYDPINTKEADLVVLDFGDLTVFKAQEGKPHGDLLKRVFALDPKAVLVTDIASRYLHLQGKNYEPILGAGSCETYEKYLEAFFGMIEYKYGYSRVVTVGTHWSSVTALIPSNLDPIDQGYEKLDANDRTGLVLL